VICNVDMCGAPRAGIGSFFPCFFCMQRIRLRWQSLFLSLLESLNEKKQIAERPVGRCGSNVMLQTFVYLVWCGVVAGKPYFLNATIPCYAHPRIMARESFASSSSIYPVYIAIIFQNKLSLISCGILLVLLDDFFRARVPMSAMLYHNTIWLDLQC
jgi:hypothetical protein